MGERVSQSFKEKLKNYRDSEDTEDSEDFHDDNFF